MNKTAKIMKLLSDLSPEERQDILNEYKETNGNDEQPAQDSLKETDKASSSDVTTQKETEAPKTADTQVKEQEQKPTTEEKGVSTETQTTQEKEVEDNSATQGFVGNEEEIDPKYEGVAIQDFVLKSELQEMFKSWQAKFDAVVDENKALKEKLETSNKENQGLKDKYESNSFGAFQQRFGAKQAEPKENYESFSQSYSKLIGKLK